VLVTKYRHPVITGDLEQYLLSYTKDYFHERGMVIQAIETMPDHIHILFDAPPQINLADFVNAFKSASSRKIRQCFSEQLMPYYWKPYFWSLSYFIGTVSERTTKAVKQYIQNQKIADSPATDPQVTRGTLGRG
jgi:putative transposase